MTQITIPLPHELIERFSPSAQTLAFIEQSRSTAKNILSGNDPRKALIIGPCSIHDKESALEYAQRFKELATEVSESCFLVMRFYVEKSRTAKGWKGFVYDPHLDGSYAIETGLIWTRELLLYLADLGVPCATEFVNPLILPYFEDLITWGFIGARTTYSQTHRQLASSLSMPIGFKNSLDGNLKSAVHSVESAAESHTCLSVDRNGKLCALQSQGNPNTHIILRGSCEEPNYDSSCVEQALQLLKLHGLPERVMIDCSHGNAQKQTENQVKVFENTLQQILEGNTQIFGLMLESHLESGNQPMTGGLPELQYAVSITDACIDWETTEQLVRAAHVALLPVSIT